MVSKRQTSLILQKQKIQSVRPKGAAKEEPEFDTSHMREIREPDVVFYIQNDGLSNFITLPKYKDQIFEVARGLEPIDGTDAKIIYMFERDYLKAGNLAKDGSIDFKDRGDIPFVDQGDVLAEKIPPKPGKDGVNIYGDTISPAQAMDLSFNIGKGVYLSRDELKVIASSEGNPKQKQSDEISVNSAYFIEGDVDYTTGHVKFDKNVYITGTIKSGFRVEAIDVVANTIDGGVVNAQGDDVFFLHLGKGGG